MGLGAAVELFLAVRAAEGASPRTIEWYRMITGRAVRRFGPERPLDGVGAPELRDWLLERRETLSPESIAGRAADGEVARHLEHEPLESNGIHRRLDGPCECPR